MPALATLTLVWLGAQKPDTATAATLERWARDRGAKLEEPHPAPPITEEAPVMTAERCETWLEQARDQLQAGDDGAAQSILARLEQSLREHPELLQASWFLAEGYRLQARIARDALPEQAARFERLAEIIEGPRAPAFGETAVLRAATAEVRVALVVHGARRHEIYWDGRRAAADDVSTAPGEHHLLVFRGARLAWAGWVSALVAGKIDVWVPDAVACSKEDTEGVTVEENSRVHVPPGVRCAAWIAAAPLERQGAVSLALCNGDQCQPMTTLGEPVAAAPALAEPRVATSFLPPWATWALAGIGVAAATSIVLWRAGVFDTAPESKVIYDGTHL